MPWRWSVKLPGTRTRFGARLGERIGVKVVESVLGDRFTAGRTQKAASQMVALIADFDFRGAVWACWRIVLLFPFRA
ncbi:MAG: hypothetical protein ABI980_16650 [Nitrospirota bacterium]